MISTWLFLGEAITPDLVLEILDPQIAQYKSFSVEKSSHRFRLLTITQRFHIIG